MQGVEDHPVDLFLRDRPLAAAALSDLPHPLHAVGRELAPPGQHGRARHAEGFGRVLVGDALGGHEEPLGLAHHTVRQRGRSSNFLKCFFVFWREGKRGSRCLGHTRPYHKRALISRTLH
jgi:hypothetical protein